MGHFDAFFLVFIRFDAHLIYEAGQKQPGLHEHEVGGRVEVGEAEEGDADDDNHADDDNDADVGDNDDNEDADVDIEW